MAKTLAVRQPASTQGRPVVRWHVVVAPGHPACGAAVGVLAENCRFARDVPVADRCQRSGCARRWPADLRIVS